MQPYLYTVVLCYDELRVKNKFSQKGAIETDYVKEFAKQGFCDEYGRVIVKVPGEHIWPRWTTSVASEDPKITSVETPIRYGDKVGFKEDVYQFMKKTLTNGDDAKKFLPSIEYAAVDYTWLAPAATLKALGYGSYAPNPGSSFAAKPKTATDYDKDTHDKLVKVGNLTVVPFTSQGEDFYHHRYNYQNANVDEAKGGLFFDRNELQTTLAALRDTVIRYFPNEKGGLPTTNTQRKLISWRHRAFVGIPTEEDDEEDETPEDREAFVQKMEEAMKKRLSVFVSEADGAPSSVRPERA